MYKMYRGEGPCKRETRADPILPPKVGTRLRRKKHKLHN